MNINASVIDIRVSAIVERNPDWFPWRDENKQKSAAFVLLCMSVALEEPLEDCIDLLTEGGNDAGVDGLHVGDLEDHGFRVTIFQGKYRVGDLDGQAHFPANSVEKAANTVRTLFDPYRPVVLNEKLAPSIEEVRSLIRDGHMPIARVVLCNNGARWQAAAQSWVDEAERDFGAQVSFEHFNHDSVVRSLQRGDRIDSLITMSGRILEENINYMRVLVGQVSVHQIARLFDDHGTYLLQRNIRRYLGSANRVNKEIRDTLLDAEKADKFYVYNNGITMVCDQFSYNALQKSDYQVRLRNVQVVNGGQTCATIAEALRGNGLDCANSAYVMVRIYELPGDSDQVVREITKATNSQTPVDMQDLVANDDIQKTLAIGMDGLGYVYKRQRGEDRSDGNVLTSALVAESVLAVWREQPHRAKFRRRDLFSSLYGLIFDNLNAAQAVLAALIYKGVEERRRNGGDGDPDFRPYASAHLSMLVGRELLKDADLGLGDISHRNFASLAKALAEDGDRYNEIATDAVAAAVANCYGNREVSLQQLAATFRRGDLLEMLAPDRSEP